MALDLPCGSDDGHRWQLVGRVPARVDASLLWLPALGVAARHYLPLADALAARGIATFIHEWRGHGSSNLRAGRRSDWGYRELLELDIPASERALARVAPGVERRLGGHSLGGQLASCRAGMAADAPAALWLVASGAPYWRAFPTPTRWWLPMAYRFLPWLADVNGALPGRRLGFGGREARGLIADWARTALSGRYAARGLDVDLEAAMRGATPRIASVTMAEDWLAPASSLAFLLSKMPDADVASRTLDHAGLGTRADHFEWMRRPEPVAEALAGPAVS